MATLRSFQGFHAAFKRSLVPLPPAQQPARSRAAGRGGRRAGVPPEQRIRDYMARGMDPVAAREQELGVRIALGSSRRALAGLVLRQGAAWMAAGLAAGALGVVGVALLLRDLLYGVPPFDPLALTAAAVALLACATAALLVPLRRATRVDPITVLR